MVANNVQHPTHMGSLYTMAYVEVCSNQVDCCSPTRHDAHSTHEHIQDLAVLVPPWFVLLVLVLMYDLTNICALSCYTHI